MLNFVNISQTVAEIWRFFDFSSWWPSAILNFIAMFLDHPWSKFAGLYWFAKFGWNPCIGFDNTKLWIFHAFGLKMQIHAPQNDPEMGRHIIRTLKRNLLAWKDVIWHTDHQNRSTNSTCARDKETKKVKERNHTVANWLFAKTTHIVRSKYRLAWWVVFWQWL